MNRVGDPLGIYTVLNREARTLKIHAEDAQTGRPLCRMRTYWRIGTDITCRLCLEIQGRYVLLEKLREHQRYKRIVSHAFDLLDGRPNP